MTTPYEMQQGTVFDELERLCLDRERGLIDADTCLKLCLELRRFSLVPVDIMFDIECRREVCCFALAQTEALYAKERCEPPKIQRKKYMRWLKHRSARLKALLRKYSKDEVTP
jgi:hypothetical protein